MASPIVRNNMTGTLEPILYTVFEAWKEFARNEKMFPKVFNMASSAKNQETIQNLTGFALFSAKTEGASIASDSYRQAQQTVIAHTTYAKKFAITREQIEDAQYDAAVKDAGEMAVAAKETQEVLAWNTFNNAFAAGTTGGDGVALCSTAHPLYGTSGGTESNRLAVDSDLTVTTLQTMINDIEDTRDNQNLRIWLKPKYLLGPSQLKWTIGEILTSANKPYTPNRERNVMQDEGLQPLIVRYLTDPDAWFVCSEKNGLLWFDRRPVDFGRDTVFDSENMCYKSTFRVGQGWMDWRGVNGTPGA